MLNVVVKMTPCKKSEALVFYGPNHCILNYAFIDDLREVDHAFSAFFKGLVNQGTMCWKSYIEFSASQRQAWPERWDKFIKFCEKDGRIKVRYVDDEVGLEIPTYFEV